MVYLPRVGILSNLFLYPLLYMLALSSLLILSTTIYLYYSILGMPYLMLLSLLGSTNFLFLLSILALPYKISSIFHDLLLLYCILLYSNNSLLLHSILFLSLLTNLFLLFLLFLLLLCTIFLYLWHLYYISISFFYILILPLYILFWFF